MPELPPEPMRYLFVYCQRIVGHDDKGQPVWCKKKSVEGKALCREHHEAPEEAPDVNIQPGDFVLVLVGNAMHVTARVLEVAGDVWWLDVNNMGVHLPQMYREAEMQAVGSPSSVLPHGLCPSCLGYGIVNKLVPPPEHEGPCSGCGGSGRVGVHVEVTRDANSSEFNIDASDRLTASCEICEAAFKVTGREATS
jgi:hypothetical protein